MLHEQLAAYALDALDGDERATFERHLATCASCQADLRGLQASAASLAEQVEPVDPPPELRDRILAQARAERPNVVPLRPRRGARPLVWIASAAVVAAVALGIWGAFQSHSLMNERSARRADQRALAVLADPRSRLTALQGADGTLAVAPDGRAVLTVAHLPAAPKGKTYEAWVISGKTPRRAGLLSGGGTASLQLGIPVPRGGLVAVTVEPGGGVDAPTGKPILSAPRAA